MTALQFGIERFVNPLKGRTDLISANDHKVLFQNIDEVGIDFNSLARESQTNELK